MPDGVEQNAASAFEEVTYADGTVRAVVRPAHAEKLCEGHFPGEPLVPGAYLAGLMADVAALLGEHLSSGRPHVVRAIEECVFSRRVEPGHAISIEAQRATRGARAGLIEARVWTQGACAARATVRVVEVG
jgi:3-hydroxymyristoyl/3-hydroxydecanoyl-(acyl carrier protein) dehydratase